MDAFLGVHQAVIKIQTHMIRAVLRDFQCRLVTYMRALRPVIVLLLAVWFLQLAGGTLSVIVPLGLAELGAGDTVIGLIAALYAAGMMIGAYIAPGLVSRTGNIRTFSAAASLTLIGSLALSFALPIWAWAPIRIVQGIGFAAMFASAEAWLGQAAPEGHRGSVLGAYNVAAKAALMTGPFLIAGAAPLAPHTFVLTGLFLACALIPVCLTHQVEPSRVETKGLPFVLVFKAAPAAVAGCFMAGIINTGTYAFLPLYAGAVMPDQTAITAAAWAFAAANAGGLIAQWPLGRLSDRIDRRSVVGVQCAVTAMIALALFILGPRLPMSGVLGLIALWGAGSLTFYGISVAHGIDRMIDGRVTELVGVLIICWATGSVLGPILAGLVISAMPGTSALFLFTAGGLIILSLIMFYRRSRKGVVDSRVRWRAAMPAPAGLMGARLHRRKTAKSGKPKKSASAPKA